MSLVDGRLKILLHLKTQKRSVDFGKSKELPYSICQKGISDTVNLSRGRTSEILKDLIDQKLIEENVGRVVGLKKRRKVYSLTQKGANRAKEIKDGLKNEEVTVITENSEYETKLENIDAYIDSGNPLLLALNKLDSSNVIDLTEEERKEEDIFVGRKDEIKYLLEEIERCKRGNTTSVFIVGHAGIGKTRLVQEFKDRIISEEIEFLIGKGHYNNFEPYLPFKDALDIFQSEENLPLEYSMVSEEKKDQNDEKVESKRRLLFSKTAENIRELSEERPIVIFIDDLQWADKASLMLFHYLAQKIDKAQLLLLGAYRPEDVESDDFLKEMIQRMSREQLFKEIELEPLDWEDTKEIMQGILGKLDVQDDFVQIVHEVSEGNPLFVKELVKQLLEDDKVEEKQGKYPSNKEEIKLPRVVRDILRRRIKKVDKKSLKILRIGSVIGERIPFNLLRSVSRLKDFELLEHVDILTGIGIWDSEPNEDSFSFSHGLFRKSVYESIPQSLKEEMHKKIALSMEELYEENLGKHYSSIANQYLNAQELSKALDYFIKAGQRAERYYAQEDAIDMYTKALDLCDELEFEEKKWDVLEKLGDVYKVIGEYENSLDYYQKIPKEKISSENEQRIYRKEANIYERKGEFDRTLEAVDKGLNDKFENSIEDCRLLCTRAMTKMRLGEYDKSEKEFLSALNSWEDFGEDREYAEILQGLGHIHFYKGKYEKSLDSLHEAFKTWEKIGDLEGKSSSLNSLGIVHLNKGDVDKALEYYERSLEMRKKTGDKRDIATTLNNIGSIYFRKGELEKALENYKKSQKIWEQIKDQQGIAISLINIGEYYLKKEKLDTAIKMHEKSLDIVKEIDFKKGLVSCLNNLGNVNLEKGDVKAAEEYFRKSLAVCENIGYKSLIAYPKIGLAKIFIQRKDLEKAMREAKEAIEISKEIGDIREEGISRKILAIIYREKKLWNKSEKEFKKGKKILREIGGKIELAELLYEYAILCKVMGEEEKKKECLKEALRMFEEIGMRSWIEKCEKDLNN